MIPLAQCASVCTCNDSPHLLSHLTSRSLTRTHTRKHMDTDTHGCPNTNNLWHRKTRDEREHERESPRDKPNQALSSIATNIFSIAHPLHQPLLRISNNDPTLLSGEHQNIVAAVAYTYAYTFPRSHKRQESIRSHTLSHIHTQEMHRKQLFGLGESPAYYAQSAKLPVCRLLCTRCQDSSTLHDRMQSAWPA